jgi:hypothetical protein
MVRAYALGKIEENTLVRNTRVVECPMASAFLEEHTS